MREIKYRGKRIDNGEWVTGYYVKAERLNKNGYEYFIIEEQAEGATYHVLPETIGQYTGMKDKNGTEIYEGDIVRRDDHSIFGVVKFGEYSQPFNDGFSKHIGFYIDWTDMFRCDLDYWAERCEVTGNLHDNPEPIEEE